MGSDSYFQEDSIRFELNHRVSSQHWLRIREFFGGTGKHTSDEYKKHI